MNECIRHRPLTMTVVCKSCGHQYGAWRPRCDACGTATPITIREEQAKFKNPPRVRTPKPVKNPCCACRQKGANDTCPTCNEPIHRTCKGLHAADCAAFQAERERLIKEAS